MCRIFTTDAMASDRRRQKLPVKESSAHLPQIEVQASQALLAKRILQSDLVAAEGKQIAAGDFDWPSIPTMARKHPLGNAAIAADEMARIVPLRIGIGLPDLHEPVAHFLFAVKRRACDLVAGVGLERAIVRHERHEVVDIVPVPGVGESLKSLDGH